MYVSARMNEIGPPSGSQFVFGYFTDGGNDRRPTAFWVHRLLGVRPSLFPYNDTVVGIKDFDGRLPTHTHAHGPTAYVWMLLRKLRRTSGSFFSPLLRSLHIAFLSVRLTHPPQKRRFPPPASQPTQLSIERRRKLSTKTKIDPMTRSYNSLPSKVYINTLQVT